MKTEDTYHSRNYLIKNYNFFDKNRVGILGWSHGGLITLINIFYHPDDYHVSFAGIPHSYLIARMGYRKQSFRDLYEAEYHIDKSANNDVHEHVVHWHETPINSVTLHFLFIPIQTMTMLLF